MRILIFLVIVAFIFSFSYRFFRILPACHTVLPTSHFSFFDLSLRINDAHATDGHGRVFLARLFHNKLGFGVFDLLKRYSQTFDPSVLFSMLSPFGTFFLVLGSIKAWREKKIRRKILLFSLFLTPFFPIFPIFWPEKLQFLAIALPRYFLSIFGLYYFLVNFQKKRAIWLVFPITVLFGFLAFTYFVYNWGTELICI